jgi:very-short-patch-repair endonuclease/tetratricopeptide (TPR) repeat protein
MRLLPKYILSFCFGLLSLLSFSQQRKIDSLLSVLKTSKEDSNKVKTLDEISAALNASDPQKSMDYAKMQLALAGKIRDKKGLGNAWHNMGNANYDMGNYPEALEQWLKALQIREENKDRKGAASSLANVGIIYRVEGDYQKSLSYFFRALKMLQDLGSKKKMAAVLGNIGSVYYNIGGTSKDTAQKNDNFKKALRYYNRGLDMARSEGSKYLENLDLSNIGTVYKDQGDYTKALDYHSQALKVSESVNDVVSCARNLANMGADFLWLDRLDEANVHLHKALKLSEQTGFADGVQEIELNLSRLSVKRKDWKGAYDHYQRYISTRDSLFNEENTKKAVRSEMNYEFDKKEAVAKTEQEKQAALAAAESRKQQIIIWSVVSGLLLVLLLAGLILRSLRITRKQKHIIELQKAEVLRQKEIVDVHQKEIIDSIIYAKRLQEAILPPLVLVKKHFPESFIFYKPKDIVAGDFYWMEVCPTRPPHRGGEIQEEKEPDYFTAEPSLYSLLKSRAEEFRSNPTQAEKVAWELFRENKTAYHIRRQHLIGRFIVDFVNIKTKTVIEIDGDIHDYQKEDDASRTKYLTEKGFEVIKFRNEKVIGDPDGFIKEVTKVLNKRGSEIHPDGEDLGGATIFIAAADCTGHGVPGAMVSLVCSNALNRTVKEFGLRETGKILDKVTELVLETFEKSGEEVKDGMDISLLSIQTSSHKSQGMKIQWSGANNPLWYIENGQLINITADKQPIGKHDNRKPFTSHTINSLPNTTYYLFTDGFADQFGGPKGKKFKYKQLEEKLIEISSQPLGEQKNILEKTFEDWKESPNEQGTNRNLEQVDDVLIIGIRI